MGTLRLIFIVKMREPVHGRLDDLLQVCHHPIYDFLAERRSSPSPSHICFDPSPDNPEPLGPGGLILELVDKPRRNR